MSWKLARPVGLCAALTVPSPVPAPERRRTPRPWLGLAGVRRGRRGRRRSCWPGGPRRRGWTSPGPLAIALLAVIAVLPEYAVDLYFSYTAGHDPDYVQYAAANMTGFEPAAAGAWAGRWW